MTQIREALQCLTLDLTELKGTTLSRSVDPAAYLRSLEHLVSALEEKCDKVSVPKPPLNGDEVWAKWSTTNFNLDKLDAREIRTLCVSPQTAMRSRLISALSINYDPIRRWINFNGFVQAYFKEWRNMDEPHNAENLILNMLANGRIQRKSRLIDLWRSSPFLFSAEASHIIGHAIVKNRKSLQIACGEYGIDINSGLASQIQEEAAAAAVSELIRRDVRVGPEVALKELKWLSDNLITPSLSAKSYRLAMAKLISSRFAEGLPAFQSALVSLIHNDERLGDPRLATYAPNWRTMPQEARDKFLAWLAKETLQFFFDTLVPRNDENRRRADFWIAYANKGKIRDFQVAVSDEDHYKIRTSRAKIIPNYSTISKGNASAFLMVFAGYGTEYVIIEFSETGNAAYIYERTRFESIGVTIRSYSFHLTDDLKRQDDAIDRIVHRDGRERWEKRASRQLAEQGIRL